MLEENEKMPKAEDSLREREREAVSSCYDVLIRGPETHTPKKRVCVLWTFTASLGNLFVRKCASAPANEFNALSKYYYLHRKEEFIVELERERERESLRYGL